MEVVVKVVFHYLRKGRDTPCQILLEVKFVQSSPAPPTGLESAIKTLLKVTVCKFPKSERERF